ncbi:MAG TPA: hypothetical protein VMS98_18365 [Thermoanaerobaculia bacterium]|nr:hypothetical protein [Thermoanaerobaculia bacterium]
MSLRDDLLRRFPRLQAIPPGCYVVGGAIRDSHLGVPPRDVDVAAPDALAAASAAGRRVIRLGTAGHLSAWRVVDAEHVYDFADLLDADIAADLARRDFTVNAMAVSLDDGALLDPHRGRDDIEARIVRMIDASNFDDDPLRCLKAVRMAVTLGMEIEEGTLEAIRSRAPAILSVAAERVTYELAVVFAAGRFRKAVDLLHQTGLDRVLFGGHLDSGKFFADDVTLAGALALLVRDPRAYAKRWRWSQAVLREVGALQGLLGVDGDRRVALYDAGEEVARQLPPLLRATGRPPQLEMPDFSLSSLLNGEEIAAAASLSPGPELGRVKRALLEAQIRGEVTTREQALAFVKQTG